MYAKLNLGILDQKYVKKVKSNVFNLVNQKSNVDLVILQSNMCVTIVFQIELMFDYLLYTKFVLVLSVPLLIAMELFDDMLLFTPMIVAFK